MLWRLACLIHSGLYAEKDKKKKDGVNLLCVTGTELFAYRASSDIKLPRLGFSHSK